MLCMEFDLGSYESRRRGGMNSYQSRKDLPNDIFTRNKITVPKPSSELAEMIGILIGDGCLTKYQVSISTNAVDDKEYGIFIGQLMARLFNLKPTFKTRGDSHCLTITISSIELVLTLQRMGLNVGHKIRQGLDIPPWILENKAYSIACLRGIFDTDGGIFIERHTYKDVNYEYPRMSFVSASSSLRDSIFKTLSSLGFGGKIRGNRSVNLERRHDIDLYFRLIGTSNPKHLKRYMQFGGVG